MYFFAYGSLQPGGEFYEQIEGSVTGSCDAGMEGRLFVHEGFPILIDAEPRVPVDGTLLVMVDSPLVLEKLDQIEGVAHPDSPYIRVRRTVLSDRGDELAWVYICKADEVARITADSVEVQEGNWRAWSIRRQ